MKRYYELNHYSDMTYYRIEYKMVCVIYYIRKVVTKHSMQSLYTYDSVIKYLQDTQNTFKFVNDLYDTLSEISVFYPHHLELNTNQFTRRLEIE